MSRTEFQERPRTRNRVDPPAGAEPPSAWLKLGLAGALGFVAGAMLFATPAEGAARDPGRPVRRSPARASRAGRSR